MQTVLITGAAKGIGAETARVFADAGYYVVINYNQSAHSAAALVERINRECGHTCCHTVQADITSEKQVSSMVDEVLRRTGRLDVLINNAGVALSGLLTHTPAEDWQRVMDVNVTGTFFCCKHVLPHMIEKKRGTIINIASVWGLTGASCEACYSASKGAVVGLSKALAKEVGLSGIRVNCVAPGVVDTDMLSGLSEDALRELSDSSALHRIGTPRDIAKACLFLASEDAAFVTGQVLSPNGGMVI